MTKDYLYAGQSGIIFPVLFTGGMSAVFTWVFFQGKSSYALGVIMVLVGTCAVLILLYLHQRHCIYQDSIEIVYPFRWKRKTLVIPVDSIQYVVFDIEKQGQTGYESGWYIHIYHWVGEEQHKSRIHIPGYNRSHLINALKAFHLQETDLLISREPKWLPKKLEAEHITYRRFL